MSLCSRGSGVCKGDLMKKKAVSVTVLAAVVLLAGGLTVWRLWPHSLEAVLSVEASRVTSLSAAVSAGSVSEDGTPAIESFSLRETSQGEEAFDAVFALLSDCDYRQDFRNLLPAASSVPSDSSVTAAVNLIWKNGEEDCCCTLSFLGDIAAVSFSSDGKMMFYHPTDPAITAKLSACLEMYGTQE